MRYDIFAFPSADSVYKYNRVLSLPSGQVQCFIRSGRGTTHVKLGFFKYFCPAYTICAYNMVDSPTWEFQGSQIPWHHSSIPYKIQRVHPRTTPTLTCIYMCVCVNIAMMRIWIPLAWFLIWPKAVLAKVHGRLGSAEQVHYLGAREPRFAQISIRDQIYPGVVIFKPEKCITNA